MYKPEVATEEYFSFHNLNMEEIVGRIVIPSNVVRPFPIMILTHGFGSSKNGKTNTYATNFLLHKGISTLRFDFSGHGESEGDLSRLTISKAIQELQCSITALKAREQVDSNRIGILGVSFGGNVAVLYAARFGGIKLLALKSPISDYKRVRERQLGAQGMKEWREKGIIDIGERRLSDYGFFLDASKINTYLESRNANCPVAIVQGNKDEVIPLRHTIQLARSLKNARLSVISGADHSYTSPRDFEIAMMKLLDFIVTKL